MTRLGLGQHASTISPTSLEKYTFVRKLSRPASTPDRVDLANGCAELLPFHRVLLLQPGIHQACPSLAVQVSGLREIKASDTRRDDIGLGMEPVTDNSVYFQLLSGVWFLET